MSDVPAQLPMATCKCCSCSLWSFAVAVVGGETNPLWYSGLFLHSSASLSQMSTRVARVWPSNGSALATRIFVVPWAEPWVTFAARSPLRCAEGVVDLHHYLL